jgi:ABC-type transport system involved in multi-copper enzyme maturation permease subunit
MNKTIYLATLKKITNHKLVMVILVAVACLIPIGLILSPENPGVTTMEGWDAFAVSTICALIIVTTTNSIGTTFSMGGRSDYMPLIVTRPIHRFQYVISKWLALTTVITIVSLTQQIMFTVSGAFTRWGLTDEMIAAGFIERILSSLSVASVLTMVYCLPRQSLVLCGVIAFEIATGISIFSLSIAVPMPETSSDISALITDILGCDIWLKEKFLPALFGDLGSYSISQYATVLVNVANFLAPQVHVYDMLKARPFLWTPFLEIISNVLLSLTIASAILNAREYHYDTD